MSPVVARTSAAVHRTRADFRCAGVNGLGGQRSPTSLEETTAADSRAAARCSGVSRSTAPRRSISWARSPGGVPADVPAAAAAGRLSVSSVFVFGMVAVFPGDDTRPRGRLVAPGVLASSRSRPAVSTRRRHPITSFMGVPAAPSAILHSVRPSTNLSRVPSMPDLLPDSHSAQQLQAKGAPGAG